MRQRKLLGIDWWLGLMIGGASLVIAIPVFGESQEDSLMPAPAAEEVRSAIGQLQQPLDGSRMQWILNSIAQQPSAQDAQLLQQALETRMRELTGEGLPSSDFNLASPMDRYEPLRREIGVLQLGSEATADDLRRRDEVVVKIAGIQDPDIRYEALRWLEGQERIARTADH